MSKLYIDDIRIPKNDASSWVVVRSSNDAKNWVLKNGIPNEISFDHDLGETDTSMEFIHWMIEKILDGELKIPEHFQYNVHSANPVGKDNIHSLMNSFLSFIHREIRNA
jgi:hypothetical protein